MARNENRFFFFLLRVGVRWCQQKRSQSFARDRGGAGELNETGAGRPVLSGVATRGKTRGQLHFARAFRVAASLGRRRCFCAKEPGCWTATRFFILYFHVSPAVRMDTISMARKCVEGGVSPFRSACCFCGLFLRGRELVLEPCVGGGPCEASRPSTIV